MQEAERAQFDYYYGFFSENLLCTVLPGPAQIDLTDDDIDKLIQAGIFTEVDSSTCTPALHLFTVPEISKKRRRLIVHTKAINEAFTVDQEEFPIKFEELLQSQKKCVSQFNFVVDIKACYNQIPLPKNSQRFYTFHTKSRGFLAMASIPTGQRHSVGVAQTVSKFLLRRAVLLTPNTEHSEAYIDNFLGGSKKISTTQQFVAQLHRITNQFSIMLNESKEEAVKSVGSSFEFRGVAYIAAHIGTLPHYLVAQSAKTKAKLNQCLSEDIPEISSWSFSQAESLFGLLIFASVVTRVATAPFYWIYKFFRRRHSQIAKLQLSRNDPAKIWPSTFELWTKWTKNLLDANPLDLSKVDAFQEATHIVWTDASLTGWGCIVHFPTGKVLAKGGPWTQVESQMHIAELEARAVRIALETFVPKGSVVELHIDNTSVIGSLRKKRSRNFSINCVTQHVSEDWKISSCHYVASKDNPADPLSRLPCNPPHHCN